MFRKQEVLKAFRNIEVITNSSMIANRNSNTFRSYIRCVKMQAMRVNIS